MQFNFKKVKKIFEWNLQIIFCRHLITRHCADSVKLPNPARLVTVSEWRAPASQRRAAVSGETHPDTGNRPTAVSGYRRSSLYPTVKPPKPSTEGRWLRATLRRRVQSTNSAPLTLMEIRFVKVGQWGRGLQLVTFVPRSRWRNTRGMFASSSMWRPSEERRT